MKIIFKKHDHDNHSLQCIRNDHSTSWMNGNNFFILHDLMHYAVEKILQLKKGFYGIVNSGIDMRDFELPKEQRKFQMTEEALFSESVVNLLTIEYNQGNFEAFNAVLGDTYQINNYSFSCRSITENEHKEIQNSFHKLITKWNTLNHNQILELEF